jgi:ATP-binding protein involved in chromosome partitioning
MLIAPTFYRQRQKEFTMRIAIPLKGDALDQHFGHCEKIALIDVTPESGEITGQIELTAPEHEHGLLPRLLKEQGVTHVIAGGMGGHARLLLQESAIEVITGAPSESPTILVNRYLRGDLQSIDRTCGHSCSH